MKIQTPQDEYYFARLLALPESERLLSADDALLEDLDEEELFVALRLDESLERELERTLGIARDPL